MKLQLIAACLALGALPAHALLVTSPAGLSAPTSVIDFSAFDGLRTTGPEALDGNVVFTGDAGSELGAFVRDLGDNGLWGAGQVFAAGGLIGELRFSFNGLSKGAGAFVNHYANDKDAFTPGIVVTAYGDNNQIIETYTVRVDTPFDSYNAGTFIGISRASADIRSLSFKGIGAVVDNFTYTTPVPEPESVALMLGGLAAVGAVLRRRRA